MLRTDEGMGVIDAQGRWLVKPERNRSLFSMAGGWVGQRGKASQPDLLWNARGQQVEVSPGTRAHAVARGLSWLELEGAGSCWMRSRRVCCRSMVWMVRSCCR